MLKLKKLLVVVSFTIIILLMIDYMDFPSKLGIQINRFNSDFSIGVLSSSVVIILFLVTYYTIDEVTKKKEKNKKLIAETLLQESYRQILFNIDRILTDKIVRENIVPKVDFTAYGEAEVITNLKEDPFSNESHLYSLVIDGQLSQRDFENYIKIKERYMTYVSMRVIAFDGPEIYRPLESVLRQEIDKVMKK
ncbi:hypothetical protein [Streptococcus henryi]|uniref:hypothetical protein n=1 Tax=Streptococcus henryi TaxID=439219 RepID=UPI00037A3AA6|nr:hypothetical protein [Streptococcus henryi]